MKVLIIGGVAGGASTAARLRRMDEQAQIIMFERGDYISFANCGLPYYIGGTIEERDELLLQTPESFNARFQVEVRTKNEVVSIQKEAKTVQVKKVDTGEVYEESYDVLVLSPGSTPLKPPIPGIEHERIFSLWNIPDTDAIKTYVDQKIAKTATVIGGGFIGLEMAENLHALGLDVTLVEMANQVMAPIDYEMAQIVHQHLLKKGVHLHLNNGVKSFEHSDVSVAKADQEAPILIHLSDGTVVSSDFVILSIGIRPNGELAKAAGLSVNERGGIVVDDHLRTSDASIYALGDAADVTDFVLGGKTMIPLAGPANKQGRIVANNIAGGNDRYKGSQGTSVAKVFDLTVAATGANEKTLIRAGKVYGEDYQIAFITPGSHAGYYPGAQTISLKLIFDKAGKVLGAQAIGLDGVEKRIDVIATAIRFGGHVEDLTELELAYAPPYSSAKDPVNMIGFVAQNILRGAMQPLRVEEIKELDLEKIQLLDVRTAGERSRGFIENSLHIPVDALRQRLSELNPEKEVAIYCAVGIRGHIASRILSQNGFKVRNLMGGYNFYRVYQNGL